MRRTSIGTWAYRTRPKGEGPVPFVEVLERLRDLRFDGIELGNLPGHPEPASHPGRDDRDRLLAELAGHGLGLSAYAPDLGDEHLLDTRDTGPYLARFRAELDFAADLGAPRVLLDTVQPPSIHRAADHGDLLKHLVATWDRCIGMAGDRGLAVAWEFAPDRAFNRPSDVQRVLDRLQQDRFGVLYDTANARAVAEEGRGQEGRPETLKGGQLELLARLSGRINHVHLLHADAACHAPGDELDEPGAMPPLGGGDGAVDFDRVVPALAKEAIGHDWWTVDLAPGPDPWRATARCKAFLDVLNTKQG
jgi:sugar phosphate isomerase/epimerase